MRVVIDTNVIASAYISPSGTPARIVDLFWSSQFVLLTSAPILDEYREILLRPRIQKRHLLTPQQVMQIVDLFRDISEQIVNPPTVTVVVADPDDDTFLACAVEEAPIALSVAMPICLTLAAFAESQS